ncbi:MAG TPA: GNAT family protein [Clostridia bacterium]|nr:GNAT family protein [Clostridia bacterium]
MQTTPKPSERLFFQEVGMDDFEDVYAVFSDARVMRYAFLDAFPTREALSPYFESMLANAAASEGRKAHEFLVRQRGTGETVGFADLRREAPVAEGSCADLGYFLLPPFWGQGYATEIGQSLLAFGFEILGFAKITGCCHADNRASQHVLEKLGMNLEAVHPNARFKDGGWHDEPFYGLTAVNWRARQPRI